ncbi:DnaD domain-containing protein [Listeria seeligeri]|uniref:DnaD domain-containing protein n=1 Tax=Listeria seeligeri TaxID=1640 RepID=UPI0022EB35BF|nr:DnaD domain protein [Listeria seeligeri]
MKGAFQMSREIFENNIWSDVIKFRLFFYIVGNAVFSENGVMKGGIQIGRGQYLRSFRNLREDLLYYDNNAEKFYSLSTIKEKIDELVREERLEITTTKLGTLFTVRNYALYQDLNNYSGTSSERLPNSHRTATEQPPNNKKNVKKDKNDKNDNKVAANAFQIYESNIGMLNPLQREKMLSWENDLSRELVAYAVTYSAEIGARGFGLVDSVISSWLKSNVRTVDDAKAFELERKNKKKQQFVRPAKQEVLPDWFDKTEKQPENKKTESESSGDLEKKVAEIKAKLAERDEVQT